MNYNRYDVAFGIAGRKMIEDAQGRYIKYEDVRHLIEAEVRQKEARGIVYEAEKRYSEKIDEKDSDE